jgi:hypothetical protein
MWTSKIQQAVLSMYSIEHAFLGEPTSSFLHYSVQSHARSLLGIAIEYLTCVARYTFYFVAHSTTPLSAIVCIRGNCTNAVGISYNKRMQAHSSLPCFIRISVMHGHILAQMALTLTIGLCSLTARVARVRPLPPNLLPAAH